MRVTWLSGLVGIGFMVLATATAHAQSVTLKIATEAPDGTTWMKEMRGGAARVGERTEGRVKLKFYPGGVMGNVQSVMRKMRVGQLHGGAFTGGGLVDINDDAQIYSLPFLFESFEEVDYVRERVDPVIIDNLAAGGMIVLGISEGGFATLFSQEPIRSLEDAAGKTAWLAEKDRLTEIIFEQTKVKPALLPLSDVYTGLQTGLMDTVPGTATAVLAFQWHTKVRYMTDAPLSYVVGMFGIAERAFKRLKPEDQQVLREEMGLVFERLGRINREDNVAAREALRSIGIEFVSPTEEELQSWRRLAADAIAQFQAEGGVNADTLELIRRHSDEFRREAASTAQAAP